MAQNIAQYQYNQNQYGITNVIKAYVYKMNPQIQDKPEYILLKSFFVSTINNSTFTKYQNIIDVIHPHIPLKYYNPQLSDQKCYMNMMQDKILYQPKAYNQDQLTYIKYCIEKSFGCQHYVRGCYVRCNQCMKFYTCMFCHNEIEQHQFPRYQTDTVKCMYCHTEQPISGKCINCQQVFGRYCNKCKLIDGLSDDGKPIFHCDKCNVCNVGFKEHSIHCDQCSRCIQKHMYDDHVCIKINTTEECPICLTSIKETQDQLVVLPCGHVMHLTCAQQLQTRFCPYCGSSMDVTNIRSQPTLNSEQINELQFNDEPNASFQ